MAKFKNLEVGKIGLIQQDKNGVIQQIGLTQEQSDILQLFLAGMSKGKPFVCMGHDYELELKN